SFVHKWLALLVGVQIVLWVVSGLFFSLIPIQQIRSEHLIRPAAEAQTIDTATLATLASVRGDQGEAPTKITIEQSSGGPVILAGFAEGRSILCDAVALQRLAPVRPAQASAIARAPVERTAPPIGATLVTAETAEYRGALPAWRVQFPDGGLSVYVAQNTGAV